MGAQRVGATSARSPSVMTHASGGPDRILGVAACRLTRADRKVAATDRLLMTRSDYREDPGRHQCPLLEFADMQSCRLAGRTSCA